ncbi:MAG: SpvB/TcaC N-terminal domain-containing protein [Polyangiaceae bacterium]
MARFLNIKPHLRPWLGLALLAAVGTASSHGVAGNNNQGSVAVCPSEPPDLIPLQLPDPNVGLGWSATRGSFSVGADGQALYEIPMDLGPGRAGMAPRLGIVYDSTQGESSLGLGFSLTGLSAITRCARNYELDGEPRGVRYDDEDAYCLDGLRLVKQGILNGSTEYRTLPDTHVRVLAYQTPATSGPTSWEVHAPGGRVQSYGGTSESRAMAPGNHVGTWSLDSEHDPRGNGIHYKYQKRDGTVPAALGGGPYTMESWLTSIDYTTPDPERHVYFDYSDRRPRVAFDNGLRFERSKVLDRVRIVGPGDESVRAYRLTYAEDDNGTRRVTAVQECDADGSVAAPCRAPVTFDWSGTAPGNFVKTPTGIEVDDETGWLVADFTADGLDDVLLWKKDGDTTSFQVSVATGAKVENGWSSAALQGLFLGREWAVVEHPGMSGKLEVTPADVDGDGTPDLVLSAADSPWSRIRYLRTDPDQRTFHLESTLLDAGLSSSIMPADINGDGLDDLVRCKLAVQTVPVLQPDGSVTVEYIDESSLALGLNDGAGDFSVAGGSSARPRPGPAPLPSGSPSAVNTSTWGSGPWTPMATRASIWSILGST